MMEYQFRIQQSFSHRGWDVWILAYDMFHKRSFVVMPLEIKLKELGEYENLPEPTLKVEADFNGGMWSSDLLKSACAELIKNGFGKQEDIQKELGAVKDHLKDFQRLVFDVLTSTTAQKENEG